jgi:hypothetical protein
LATTQSLLWSLITAPEGVAAALDGADARGSQLRAELLRTVCDDPQFGAAERLDVYANMYFFRLLDVLRDDFPAVVAVAGDDAFHNLVTDYLLRHFPSHHSLRQAGRFLPAFLATHSLAQRHPGLPDLARFEWALCEAFDAANAPAATTEELRAIAPEQWPGLCLRLHPSVQLLVSDWDVRSTWMQQRAGEAPRSGGPSSRRYCVWRQNLRVFHREVEAAEWAGLQALAVPRPFSAVCEGIAACLPDTADPASTAAAFLARWAEDGLMRGI